MDISTNMNHIESLLNSLPSILPRNREYPRLLPTFMSDVKDTLNRFRQNGMFDTMG